MPQYGKLFDTTEEALSINDAFDSLFTVSPNPSSNVFNLTFKNTINKLTIELLSLNGKPVKKVNISNTNKARVDISNLSKGMHILKVNSDDKLSIEKVIKIQLHSKH
ncbi:T9SS type A sorting domain-containing protein [Polaribacter sp.]|nr:T9SS type A sorting domain-containing protein [Polaribacter sp.]